MEFNSRLYCAENGNNTFMDLSDNEKAKGIKQTIADVVGSSNADYLDPPALEKLFQELSEKYPECEFRGYTTSPDVDSYYDMFYSPANSNTYQRAVVDSESFYYDEDDEIRQLWNNVINAVTGAKGLNGEFKPNDANYDKNDNADDEDIRNEWIAWDMIKHCIEGFSSANWVEVLSLLAAD